MRKLIPVVFGIALLFHARPGVALPPKPTVAQLLDICSSVTVAEAAGKGGRLGWERMDEARIAPWRASFTRSGQAVEVVGWFRGPQERDGRLSFWIMAGAPLQRTCSYSVGDASGLLEELSGVFGPARRQEVGDTITSAEWAWRMSVVSFIQVGAGALVTVRGAP